jgi:hypothetical protein
MDWRYGPSGRVSSLQTQNPELKPQSHQKKEKEGKENKTKSQRICICFPEPELLKGGDGPCNGLSMVCPLQNLCEI